MPRETEPDMALRDDGNGEAASEPSARQRGPSAPTLADLPSLSTSELRGVWRDMVRQAPPPLSRDLILRALAYRIQEVAQGGLSRSTQRQLRSLARKGRPGTGDGRQAVVPSAPTLRPGTRLVREWHGRSHVVTITQDGFEHEGQRYRSLSQIAKRITGSHWSGPRFFGLTGRKVEVARVDD